MTTLNRILTLCFILLCWSNSYARNTTSTALIIDTIAAPASPDTATRRYLALGDSYTIGQSVKKNERYPAQLVEQLRYAGYKVEEPEIIATTGWTTGNLLEAVKDKSAAPSYDIVTLLIGVNNQYQRRSIDEYRTEFTLLIKKAIRLAGNRPSRVVVLSIPDYSVTPFAKNSDREAIAREINLYNRANKRIADLCHVNYVDVTSESRKAAWDHSLIAYDDLHFSGKEYGRWTFLLAPVASDLLRK